MLQLVYLRRAFAALVCFVAFAAACSTATKTENHDEEEAIARTEFTDRIENFFEYTPLKAGKSSQFLIHLTDLQDGAPVEKAAVALKIRKTGTDQLIDVKAKVGRVTGIYVAEVELPEKGKYEIEFRIKNEKLDEKLALEDFEVE